MTKSEKNRIDGFHRIGCIITGSPQYDVHHITDCGRRMGHLFTIPLHPWFHRGYTGGDSVASCRVAWGPSLELDKKSFVEQFGTELELLAKTNAKLKS